MRCSRTTRAEQHTVHPVAECADHTVREAIVRGRPMPLSVEADLVGNALAGLEVLDDDQCVVVAGHSERGRRAPQDLDGRRGVGLHPHGRRRAVDVTQHRPEDQLWHEQSQTAAQPRRTTRDPRVWSITVRNVHPHADRAGVRSGAFSALHAGTPHVGTLGVDANGDDRDVVARAGALELEHFLHDRASCQRGCRRAPPWRRVTDR